MVKTILGILPWALVLAAVGGAVWWLLSREMGVGRWVLAAVLIGHGAVHVLFSVPSPVATDGGQAWPFDIARSWAVTGAGLEPDVVRVVGAALISVVVGGFVLAALSAVGILVPPGWWPASVAVAALTSALVLVLFFQPELVLGLGIDAVLLWVVIGGAWSP